jgi:hypothetical protein
MPKSARCSKLFLVARQRLLARCYHNHIVRNAKDLDRLREYVIYNTARWAKDTLYTS